MSAHLLRLLEKTRRIGTWWVEVETATCHWSETTYEIHEEDPSKPIGLADGIEYYVPEHRPNIERCVQEGIEHRKPWDVELKIRTARGNVRWVRAIGEPVFDGDRVVQLRGMFEDIHSRKSLEVEREGLLKQVEDLNRRLTLALEASKIGVWEWDITTNDLIWDPQMYELYGVSKDDFDGAYSVWENGLHPEEKEAATARLRDSVERRSKFDTQFRIIRPVDGAVRTIRAMADLQLDSQNQPRTMVGLNWDITDTERTKRELERSNEELAQLAYRASHDLKAPLTTIKGLARFVALDIAEGQLDEATRNAEVIMRQAASLEKMVLGILDTAKADLAPSNPEEVDLTQLVEEVVEGHRSLYEADKVSMRIEVDTSRRYLFPRARVYQILTNLVSNAIKYSDRSKDSRFVRVSASAEHSNIVITVEDNGCGIPAPSLAEIYTMFRTFHPAGGSGIGLYIVKKHVEALSGEISVDSSTSGTTFRVEFFAKAVD